MKERKDKIVAQLVGGVEGLIKKNKIELIKGEGEILSPRQVKVTLSDGSEKLLKMKC